MNKIILTGNQSGTNTGDFLDSKAQIKFNSTGRYASIWKTGSTSSNNNAFRIYCGTNSTTSNVGIRYPLMTLANQNGTFTAQIGPVDVSNVRQEFDNEIVLMKTLKSGVINATNVTTTTADSTDAFGDAQKTTTQTAATVPAILTFTGDNIHTGLNTHNGNVHHEGIIESRKTLRIHNCEDATSQGALLFKWNDSTASDNTSHILFQGSGSNDSGANPGTYTFARDTTSNNVSATDKYFSLIAPRANGAGVKTVFHMQAEFENDIKFTEAAADQDIDVSGVNSKHLKIKATDSNGDLQQVARLSVAESVLNGNTFYCSSGQIYFNQASSINYSGNSDVVDLKISGRNSKSLLIKNPSDTGAVTNTFETRYDRNKSYVPLEVPTPTADAHAATKEYVDSHANGIDGGQQSGSFTVTFDGTGTTPGTKQTATAHYRKYGHLTHVHVTADGLSLSGYANGAIRITGLPHQPDTSIGEQIGHIHAVNFMSNTYHADDGHIAVVDHDATYGSHIKVFSEQVNNETVYISNASSAKVRISITYIATS